MDTNDSGGQPAETQNPAETQASEISGDDAAKAQAETQAAAAEDEAAQAEAKTATAAKPAAKKKAAAAEEQSETEFIIFVKPGHPNIGVNQCVPVFKSDAEKLYARGDARKATDAERKRAYPDS